MSKLPFTWLFIEVDTDCNRQGLKISRQFYMSDPVDFGILEWHPCPADTRASGPGSLPPSSSRLLRGRRHWLGACTACPSGP